MSRTVLWHSAHRSALGQLPYGGRWSPGLSQLYKPEPPRLVALAKERTIRWLEDEGFLQWGGQDSQQHHE
eukprot:6324697-Amphidinium_carterae.1